MIGGLDLVACEDTTLAPGGLNPLFEFEFESEVDDDGVDVVVLDVGHGECELAVGS